MSASSQQKNTSYADWDITDPGNGAVLPNDVSGTIGIVATSGSQTNTLAAPARVGLELTLYMKTAGGLRTVTVDTGTGFDETGNETLSFVAAGSFVKLQSMQDSASNLVWRVVASDNLDGPSNVIYSLNVAGTLTITDGGTVTQATNKGTTVSLSKRCGQITMNGAELAAAAEVTFQVTNTLVAAPDVIVVNHSSAGTAGAYLVGVSLVTAGSFKVTVANVSAGALSEAIVISFALIGGSAT